MRDHEPEMQKDGAQGQPPQKLKAGGEHERAHKQADGHPAAHPDILRDERLAHPANAEPLAELLSQLQHSHGNAYVQRVVSDAGEAKTQETHTPAESHTQSNTQGLDAGTRSLMESAFGESFGDVRVHTGGAAEKMNEEQGARAITHGRDIYFHQGEYDPSTQEGRHLLAHELTHVVQQRGGVPANARASSAEQSGDSIEREADRAASAVLSGQRAEVKQRGSAPAYQREEVEVFSETTLTTQPAQHGFLSGAAPDYWYNHHEPTNARELGYDITIHLLAGTRYSVVCDHPHTVHDPHPRRLVEKNIRIHITGHWGGRPGLRLRLTNQGYSHDVRIIFPPRPPRAPTAPAAPAAPVPQSPPRH